MAYKPRKDIKVSESYIQKLRDTGSKKAALEKYGKSTDPKMREALRRFYGASAPAPMTDSKRAKLATLPRKSVDIKSKTASSAKPSRTGATPARGNTPYKSTAKSSSSSKSNAQKVDSFVRGVYKNAGPENFIAGGIAAKGAMKVGKGVIKLAKSKSIAKNTKTLKTATGSKANLARTKVGYAKGLATKTEVKQAKAAVRSTTAQKVSSAGRTGRDTAKYYGSTAKNMSVSTRAQKVGEMRSNQQAVANASKKKATALKRAETVKSNKVTSVYSVPKKAKAKDTAAEKRANAAYNRNVAKRASKAGK